MPAETRTLLRRLAACSGVHLAIISGRALADIQVHVGISGIFYAGNHGLELCGPGIEFHDPRADQAHGELAGAVALIVEAASGLEGVFVEDKGVSAAVHWRLAPERSRTQLHELMRLVADVNPHLRLTAGKCVWELRPQHGWNKGNVLMHLIGHLGLDPEEVIFLGDDLTDEDAFRVMPGGCSFRVGGHHEFTAARYYLNDEADARAFLLCLLGLRTGLSPLMRGISACVPTAVG